MKIKEKIWFKIDVQTARQFLIVSTGPVIYARNAGLNIIENTIKEGEKSGKWFVARYDNYSAEYDDLPPNLNLKYEEKSYVI